MEKITGMKITRERPGRVMQKPPRELVFYNSEGENILTIWIGRGIMRILPRGANVLLYDNENWPLYRGESPDGQWVETTDFRVEDEERVFPAEE